MKQADKKSVISTKENLSAALNKDVVGEEGRVGDEDEISATRLMRGGLV
jgi:hypothetical protein